MGSTTWLLALGSRGDVQPMAVLARRLVERGHPAVVIGLQDAAPVCDQLGVGFVGVDARVADALVMARGRVGEFASRSEAGQGWLLRRWLAQMAGRVAVVLDRCVQPGDAVVTGVLGRRAALALCDGRQARMATVVFTGQLPTRYRESSIFDTWFGRSQRWNHAGVWLGWLAGDALGSAIGDRLDERLGRRRRSPLAGMRAADRWPTLLAASPVLVPPADDWPSWAVQTGWLGSSVPCWEPDDALAEFLAAGSVVWVGWGSFSGASRPEDVATIVRAAGLSGVGVVTPTVPGIAEGRLDARVLAVGPLPHSALFRRLAGVVHHGGAGTTQEGLRAGVPSMAVPFGVDQPYHGRRLHALGVGPAPVPIRALDADLLAERLDALVTTASYCERAREVSARMRDERGPDAAVDALTRARVV